MSIPEDNILWTWALKIAGVVLSFIGGVVTATWIVATKVKGFDDRLRGIEVVQEKCPGKALQGINQKIDEIPERIERKMDERFERVHARIDEVIMRGKE